MANIRSTLVALGVTLLTPTESSAYCDQSSASSRLQVYCLSNIVSMSATNVGTAQILDFRLKQEGYARGIGLPGVVDRATFVPYVYPILEYSSDINGGNPNKPLVLGSLTFFGDEEFFKKDGVIVGLGIGGSGRYIYGEGRYADYSIGASYAHSIEYDIGVERNFADLCSKNDIGGNFYLDGCLSTNQLNRELADETTSSVSLSVAKLFSDGDERFNEFTVGLRKLFKDNFEQKQLTFKLETLHDEGYFTAIGASFGGAVENQLVIRQSLNATVGTTIRNRPVSASFSYTKSNGGRLLGFTREDTTTTFNLTYAVKPNINASVGYSETNSSISYFDESESIFGIQFSPIRF